MVTEVIKEHKIARFQVYLSFTMTAFDILKGIKIERVTSGINFRDLLHRFLTFTTNTDQTKPQ